jgi:hypothetical protein
LIEAKRLHSKLKDCDEGQLRYYFHSERSKVAILTNGYEYRFYTDIDEPNKMDVEPFMTFTIETIDDLTLNELKKFTKSAFDVDNIKSTASDLRYTRAIRDYIAQQLIDPSDDFVKHFTKQVYKGQLNKKALENFKDITKNAFATFIRNKVSEISTLPIATEKTIIMKNNETTSKPNDSKNFSTLKTVKNNVITDDDASLVLGIIRDILSDIIQPDRISSKKATSSCGFRLDTDKKLVICYILNHRPWIELSFYDDHGVQCYRKLKDWKDIYKHANIIIEKAKKLLNI